jgi:hypothetical protein
MSKVMDTGIEGSIDLLTGKKNAARAALRNGYNALISMKEVCISRVGLILTI